MKASDIIRADSLRRRIDPEETLTNIAYMVKKGNATLLHAGKTVLLLVRFSPKAVELHLFTQDAPDALLAALRHFVATIRKTKLEAVYGRADNKGILTLLRRAKVKVEESNLPQYNWMAKI